MSNKHLSECPLCRVEINAEDVTEDFNLGIYHYRCKCCGHFGVTNETDDVLPRLSPSDLARLRGAVREQSELAQADRRYDFPLVQSDNIVAYLSGSPSKYDVPAKARKLLNAIARFSRKLGGGRSIDAKTDFAIAYAEDRDELVYLINYAQGMRWITGTENMFVYDYHLTPKGWEELQHRPSTESNQCFVAMAFAEVMQATFTDAIYPAVRDDCGFDCKRIDAKEYNGAIVDEIKAEIRQSRFVIADVTHHRNGVYFEAGFADGLGVPVIWTCDDTDADNTHFDAKHLNQIRWTSHDDLRTRLSNRILGTIGRGPMEPRGALK